ncbi:succinylglutamate desuccinylase/aspartoacylase domain-containing protein [Vogesella oryzae]|uniref:succinylglutamate desuccinylase/aspartoacylase domain-containing protein n=1 Tax=Vogesella oryzae TaxID=1735285 RepID=UPI001581D074|nr:succinylglutamate desuccinylase/aspartoacylase family protein [Vogesella oryzae]
MIRIEHQLPGDMPGHHYQFYSYHFGAPDAGGPHVYLQAGLHADELPGVLLLHRLRQRLAALEEAGRVRGRVTLVPMANPVGMAQHWQGQHHGRFAAGSGENFNRHYPDLSAHAAQLLQREEMTVKQALLTALAALPGDTLLQRLRHSLFTLALPADYVLDVHCDSEAVLHLYANHRHADAVAGLAGWLQAEASLLCDEAGGMSFDDAIVQNWRRLEAGLGLSLAIPFAATVELRGVADVSDTLAAGDEAGLLGWLTGIGVISGAAGNAPAPPRAATPLAAVECVTAPQGGVLVYQADYGQWLPAGSQLGYVLDPHSGAHTPLLNRHAGYYFARVAGRLVNAGTEVAYLAGEAALRSGMLLSA